MQNIANSSYVVPVLPNLNSLVFLGNSRKADNDPIVGFAQNRTGQVVRMNTLHHDDDRARPLVVEALLYVRVVPFLYVFTLGARKCIGRFLRIIDDDNVAAESGECRPDGGSPAITVPGGVDGVFCIPRNSHPGECTLVPWSSHDRAKVVGKLICEVQAVMDGDQALARIAAQYEGGKCHRTQDRFQRARREIENETRDLAKPHQFEMMGDHFDVRIRQEWPARPERVYTLAGEAHKIAA